MEPQLPGRELIFLCRRHRIVCERSGKQLTWTVDGRKVAEYNETFRVLNGPYIGLYTDAGGYFDNIKVYVRQ